MTRRGRRPADLVSQGPDQGPPPREHPPERARALPRGGLPPRDRERSARRGGARRADRRRPRPRHPQQDARHRQGARGGAQRSSRSAASASGPTRSTSPAPTAAACPVFNAPFSNTRSVAEMIIAEIVMLSRRLGDRSREMHAGQWSKVATGSFEVRGKTLGIVGYGHIGRQLGVLAETLGMRVLFFDVVDEAADGQQPLDEDARRAPAAERLRDAARARDAADARHDRRARARDDEGRAPTSSTPAAAPWSTSRRSPRR